MQGAAYIMMTLDIAINFWLTDSYLRAMKGKAGEMDFKMLWHISLSYWEIPEVSERYDG